MNATTPYEKLIADKLDKVPVPDMADTIWAGIEAQLDVVTGTPAKKPLLKGKGWYIFTGVTVIVALLLVLWYKGHKSHAPKNTPVPKQQPAVNGVQPAKDSIKPGRIIKPKAAAPSAPGVIKAPPVAGKDSVLLNQVINNDAAPDSISQQTLPPVKTDSPFVQSLTLPAPVFNPVITRPKGKKPKGVKGITSDDYKISVQKDSTKKGN